MYKDIRNAIEIELGDIFDGIFKEDIVSYALQLVEQKGYAIAEAVDASIEDYGFCGGVA